jgi:glycosyltransferase involved in cell wall biosynthesis
VSRARIAVAAVQSPFLRGGAERHVERLVEELRRRDIDADLVTMPLLEQSRFDIVKSALLWRMTDLSRLGGSAVDAVIATRFPSYLTPHPRKVAWVIHQYRQAYDQFGTIYSDLTGSEEDVRLRRMIYAMDRKGLGEARKIFANSRTVAERLERYNGISSTPLYHPPPLSGRYRSEAPGQWALWVGRLEGWKRPELAVGALAHAPSAMLNVVGTGPDLERLRRRAQAIGVDSRCRFLGSVSDDELLELYARARIVLVTACEEDYGYVALEAFLSERAVLTVRDAGGPLEFVRDGKTGIVVPPTAEALGRALEVCWNRVDDLGAMGRRGRQSVEAIQWDDVVAQLCGAAGV